MKKNIYTKEHSREYSLFRLACWYDSMSNGLKRIVGVGQEEACAIYEGGDLVSIYYEPNKLKNIFQAVTQKCQNKTYITKQIELFLTAFNKLKKYYTGKRKIKDIKELIMFQKLYAFSWAYIAIFFLVPRSPVDKEIKKLALDVRTMTQKYNEIPEEIFKEALERFFPKLKGNTRFILPEEVLNKRTVNTEEILETIKERKKGFVYYMNKIYTGNLQNNLDILEIKLIDTDSVVSGKAKTNSMGKLEGQIAYKGKVNGKVVVISSVKRLNKVKKGDILVASMTMPKYLQAMKKASAFITDEGGITCHAAIIAREMKKPCIIGTKIATKVLRDGDLVEVDADNGIIRIIKRSK